MQYACGPLNADSARTRLLAATDIARIIRLLQTQATSSYWLAPTGVHKFDPSSRQAIATDEAAMVAFNTRNILRPSGLPAEVAQKILHLHIVWIESFTMHRTTPRAQVVSVSWR